MKYLCLLPTILFCITSPAQKDIYVTYEHYQIYYDSITERNYIHNTKTASAQLLDFYPSQDRFKRNRFRHGFIQCKRGDMSGLITVEGDELLDLSHFIQFNSKDRIISAFVCDRMEWVLLNFQGDTISHGYGIRNNYVPKRSNKLNKALSKVKDGKIHPTGIPLYGFIDQQGNWIIEPKFHRVKEWKEGHYVINHNNLWGIINQNGQYIVPPIFNEELLQELDFLDWYLLFK